MNDTNWSEHFAQILAVLVSELVSKANFIETTTRSNAEKLLEGLDAKGLKEWQDGVNAGIKCDLLCIICSPQQLLYFLPPNRVVRDL